MWRKFCGWLLKRMGWTIDNDTIIPEDKAIILGVPHTSGWDFVISYLFYTCFMPASDLQENPSIPVI